LNELSRTSGQGKAVPVSEELWKMLERAQALAARTEGAFDITVGPCVSLWRRARRTHEMPSPERLTEALHAVGYMKLRLNSQDHTAELVVPNMKLDLGGIAKGYAVDEALRTVRVHGIKRALVAGAGDLAVSDPPPGRKGWRVEIAPLDLTNAPPRQFVLLTRSGLATSGDLFQHLEIDGTRYSHIVNPRTGIGLTDHSLVTVIAPDCMSAGSLATALSVVGPERGMKLIEETPQAEAHVVRKPQDEIEVRESAGFNKYVDAARE
jgi:thiamine biosynthesis lipoprotein